MSLRTLTRTPKYYLVYFYIDKTMSVISREKLLTKISYLLCYFCIFLSQVNIYCIFSIVFEAYVVDLNRANIHF